MSELPPGALVGSTATNLDGVMALERPPRWGLIAIVVLLLANVGLVILLVQRQSGVDETPASAAATSTAARTSSAPASGTDAAASSPTASDETTADRGTLAVYGDGYSSGNSEGGTGAAGWPALVSQQLGMTLQLSAATLAGYVRPGSTDQTYPQLVAAQRPAGAAVTVVFGSRNDVNAAPGDVQAAATATFAAIRSADPSTKLVVIGPCWSSTDVPAELTAVSAAVQAAAQQAGATYLDPVQQGWFADPNGLVSAADGISLLDAGHTYLAGLIAPLVETAAGS